MDIDSQFKPSSTRLMDQVREVLRFYHYAYSTEQAYVSWIFNIFDLTISAILKKWVSQRLSVF